MSSESAQLPSAESKIVESNVIGSATNSKPIDPNPPYDGKSTIIYAPDRETQPKGKSIFLAGSIDMGTAEDWQQTVINRYKDLDITIYNPRRKDWDPSWKQKKSFPPFREQVEWELDMLSKVDVIMMYLAPDSIAPISLLELGTFGTHSNRMVVGCPERFHRQGNVDIVCERYGIKMVDDFDKLLAAVRERLGAPPEPVRVKTASEEQKKDV